jgi:hypothetical protein
MFSFQEKGSIKPVAEIIGKGKLKGKFLFLHRKDGNTIPDGFFEEITLPAGLEFQYFPDPRHNQADVISTAGARGAGKSYLAAKFAEINKKVFNLDDDDVIIIKKSRIEDPAYEKLNARYIYVDEEFLHNPPTVDEIGHDRRPKLVIIDDVDTLQSSKLKACMVAVQNELVQEGRKYEISVIVCAHSLCSRNATKALLTESTYFGFFPSSLTADFTRCLKVYGDMSDDIIRDLKSYGSRWVLFHQHSPKFILQEHKACIFDYDKETDRLADIKLAKKEQRLLKRTPLTETIRQARLQRQKDMDEGL